MIIVEGADYTGKSTFCRILHERLTGLDLRYTPAHLSRPEPDFDYYRDYLQKIHAHHLWDRFHLSGVAYRVHDDRPCSLNPVKFQLVESEFRRQCGYSIILHADNDAIIARAGMREKQATDSLHPLERILHVNETFIGMAETGRALMRNHIYSFGVDAQHDTTSFDKVNEFAAWVVSEYVARLREWSRLTGRAFSA